MAIYYNGKQKVFIESDLDVNIMEKHEFYPLLMNEVKLNFGDSSKTIWVMTCNDYEIISGEKFNLTKNKEVLNTKVIESSDEIEAYFLYADLSKQDPYSVILGHPKHDDWTSEVRAPSENPYSSKSDINEGFDHAFIINDLFKDGGEISTDLFDKPPIIKNNFAFIELFMFNDYNEILEKIRKNTESQTNVVQLNEKSFKFETRSYVMSLPCAYDCDYAYVNYFPFLSNMYFLNFDGFVFGPGMGYENCLSYYRHDIGSKPSTMISYFELQAIKSWIRIKWCGNSYGCYEPVSSLRKRELKELYEYYKYDIYNVEMTYINIYDIPKEILNNIMDLDDVNKSLSFIRAYRTFNETFSKMDSEQLKNSLAEVTKKIECKLIDKFEKKDEKLRSKINKSQETVKEIFNKLDTITEDSRFNNMKEEFFKTVAECFQNSYLKFKNNLEQDVNNTDNKRKELITFLNKVKKELKEIEDNVEIKTKEKLKNANDGLDELEKYFKKLQIEQKQFINDLTEEVLKNVIEKNPVQEININLINDEINRKIRGVFHKSFKKVLQLVSLKSPVFLVGPSGCGKNVMLKQVSKVLDLDFYYINDAREKYDLLGFVDANGKYQETQFFKAFTKGGLLMIDEMDSSDASVLLLLNSALGTGDDFYMTFPDGNQYQAHPDFHLVAAANTYGTGSTQIYNGRNQLDGASLNRFVSVYIDYDTNIESTLVNNSDILPLYWEVRRIIKENEINYVVSTRNILNADRYLSSKVFDIEEIFDWTLIGSMTEFDLGVIISNIKITDKYTDLFIEYVKKKYNMKSAKTYKKNY